jgi:hypothetical protein
MLAQAVAEGEIEKWQDADFHNLKLKKCFKQARMMGYTGKDAQ